MIMQRGFLAIVSFMLTGTLGACSPGNLATMPEATVTATLISSTSTSVPLPSATASKITSVTTNLAAYPSGKVPQYEKFEISLTLSGSYTNPFDPAQVRVDGYFVAPDHSMVSQLGFYYQDYTMTLTGGAANWPNVSSFRGVETFAPVGNPVWKVRFAPQQAGVYQYYVKVTDGSGTTTSSTSSFEAVDTGNPGFIRISSLNHRYFAFDNGHPFIGVGLNVGWWQDEYQRIAAYRYYFGQMHDYKANLARVWMTNSGKNQDWILSIQDKTLGAYYDLKKAWVFDDILEMARQDGVYILLTLDDFNQYTYNWPINLYNTALNGPCAHPSCIFTNATAKDDQRRLFRYIVARWGYSSNVLSWELFNEINELEWSTPNWDWCQVVGWHQEMARYIQSIDAYKHLVNSSTGSFKTFGGSCSSSSSQPNLYAAPEIGFAEIHAYYVPGCCDFAPSDPAGQDMANFMRYYAHLVYNSVSGKPSIIGEWGILNQNWTDSTYLATDDKGVSLHNGLWASVMSGMAATGLSWHWGYHRLHDPAWWQQYRGIANYIEGIDIANMIVMKPLNVDFGLPSGSDDGPDAFASTNSKLRAMGLRSGSSIYAWIQNTENTWWNVVHGTVPSPQTGTITIYGLTPGTSYSVTRWDTYAGQIARTDMITARSDGSIQVVIQNLENDVALKIHP